MTSGPLSVGEPSKAEAPGISGVGGIPSSSSLAVYKRASPPPSLLQCPSAHTGHPGLVWVPVGLVVHHGQLGLQRLTSPPVVSAWTKLQPSFQPFAYFSGNIEPFQPCPYYESWISYLEQIANRGLRTSSCFLNLAPDVCGRMGYGMHSQKGLSLEGEGIHTHIYSLCSVFVAVWAFLSMGFSLQWLLLFQSTGSRAWALVVSAPRLNCSMTHGISLDQGWSPYALHWHVDSFPVSHQKSPCYIF